MPATGSRTPRRVPRSQKRAEFWVPELAKAADGDEALMFAWRWLRKELTAAQERRGDIADAAAWDLARWLAQYSSRLPRAQIRWRKGLTLREQWRLLNPWAKEEDNPHPEEGGR